MIRAIRYIISAAAAGAVGVSSAMAGTAYIGDTGRRSVNNIELYRSASFYESTRNQASVNNGNHQWALSGDAVVTDNTYGGHATSGVAWNSNRADTSIDVGNPARNGWRPAGNDYDAGVGWTGRHSSNAIYAASCSNYRSLRRNYVDVSNDNYQSARSGDAVVAGNTYGGDAATGWAYNSNQAVTDVTIGSDSGSDNWDSWEGSSGSDGHAAAIQQTGPHSSNYIDVSSSNRYSREVVNSVDVDNSNHQAARSGDAVVAHNTVGGDATSGAAANVNSAETVVNVPQAAYSGPNTSADASSAVIEDTGRGSHNAIQTAAQTAVRDVVVNDVAVANHNAQSAVTGDAVVTGNDFGGQASTGNAVNTNSAVTTVNL